MMLMIAMNNNLEKIKLDFRAMGTDVSVEIIFESLTLKANAQKALQYVQKIFTENEKIFSRFSNDSELARINRNIGKEVAISNKMFAVLELCLKFNKISEGYFDPRIISVLEKIGYDKDFKMNDFNVSEDKKINLEKIDTNLQEDLILSSEKKTILIKKRIDTTGIAKGFTVDECARFLKKEGFKNFIVDAGGDMFAQGFNKDGKEWAVGVEGAPDDKIIIKLNQEGIATSGISRKRWKIGEKKFHHLINPKDPENFSYEIKTVTVVDKETVEADGRAKVLVLMGKEKGLEFANKNNIKALFLDYRGNVYLSNEIKKNIY